MTISTASSIGGGQIIGTVVQNFGREAFRNGWKIIEVQDDSESRGPRQGGVEHQGLCVHDPVQSDVR